MTNLNRYGRSLAIQVLMFSSLLLLPNFVLSQITQSQRFEREQKGSDELYTIISLKEEGLALLRQKNKFNGNKKIWEIIVLDTALQERKTVEFQLEERYPLIGYEVTSHHLYLLFRTGETVKNTLMLLEFNTTDGVEKKRYEIKPEVDFKITHFSKVGSSLALGGYVSNDPAILLFSMSENSIKVVPGFFIEDNELVELRVNQNQTFNIVLIDRSTRSERKMIFKTFDESGKLLLEDVVPIEEDRTLHTSISSTLQREELMVMGTWGDKQSKQSTGFFSLPVDPFGEQKINYFHFGELKHFVDYLNPKRAERIKANTKEDLQEGRKPSFIGHVIPYKVVENSQGFIMLSEVYSPVSTSPTYNNSPYGSPYYSNPYYYAYPFWPGYYPGMRYRPYNYGPNVKNQDEVKSFATIVTAFDAQGKLVWDQSFKFDEIKRPSLDQIADFYLSETELTLLYKKESEIRIKKITLSSDQAAESIQKLKLLNEGDEVRNEKEEEDGLRHWTGNSFYVWGYQTIRNPEFKDDKVRDIFYINKVVVP